MSEQIDENECRWLRGEIMVWGFDEPMRIVGFEIRGANAGSAISVQVNLQEQLAAPPIPMFVLELMGKESRLYFPPCTVLEIGTEGFSGELRPLLRPLVVHRGTA